MQQRIRVICCCLVTQFCPTLFQPHGLQVARFLCPWDLPGKTIGVGCHFLLQEIFPIRGSNQCLLHWQADSSPLSQQNFHSLQDPCSQRLWSIKQKQMFFRNSCFFDDPAHVGNLISGSSAFSEFSLNIWKFTVHILLKPGLKNFEHYFTSM